MAPKARHSGVGLQIRSVLNAHGRVNVGVDAFAATVAGDAGIECLPHVTQVKGVVDAPASDLCRTVVNVILMKLVHEPL